MSTLASVQMSMTYKHSKSSAEAPCSYLSVSVAVKDIKISWLRNSAPICYKLYKYFINLNLFILLAIICFLISASNNLCTKLADFRTTVLQAIYIYNKYIYFISILLARIIVVLNLPISCTEILNTTNSISLISYWSSIIFMHEISRFSTTIIVAIYIYNKFIYFISILLARIIVVLNLPISCTEIEFVVFSISLIS